MPEGAIVDAHLHLWDPRRISYPWLDGNSLLNRPYLLDDWRVATRGQSLEAMVFVQCEAAPEQSFDEAMWVAGLAQVEPRIAGIVAWAALERGEDVRADLERLAHLPLLRGIRRIVQFEPDPQFCLQPAFIDGVRMLAEYGLSFDICTDAARMGSVLEFAAAAPDVPMVLDHIGKPAIAAGQLEPWRSQIRTMAQLPHVWCKISGVATEADHANWTPGELQQYVEIAIDAFGFERIMFGGDWPVALQAIQYERWIAILDEMLAGCDAGQRAAFWRNNAKRFYRLAH